MMYPFMTLDDGTEIVHSEAYMQDGIETVKVYFECPVNGGFDSAECYLPHYEWKNIHGFPSERVQYLQGFLESIAHIIYELAREGGFDHAANL